MKETIRELFLGLGADVCGFAAAESFTGAPAGFRPADLCAECRTVIVFAKALGKSLFSVNPRILYEHALTTVFAELDSIAFTACMALENEYSAVAVPVPADTPYDVWDPVLRRGQGLLSMRHAAVLAGLGTLGKHTLLISPAYGTRLSLCAVLTSLELGADAPAPAQCIEGCRICLEGCPAHALDGISANQKLCRANAYEQNARGYDVCSCNTCRAKCPRMAAGSAG